jgi:NTP pyrophosphatase (non-canonical NTP hydrolase)
MRAKKSRNKRTGTRRNNRTSIGESSGFDAYQKRACETIHGPLEGQKGHMASMLGLASETGSILDSHKRYLRDSIDLPANKEFLSEELGDLLWYIAAVATACDLKVRDIAIANLRRTRGLYKRDQTREKVPAATRIQDHPQTSAGPISNIVQDFSEYQRKASQTSKLNLRGPEGPIAPMMGLASATGNILDFPKNNSQDIDLTGNKKFFLKELGDLLWYTSAVATACDLDLGVIAETNITRAHDLYTIPIQPLAELFDILPTFDDASEPTECFPRLMIVGFEERAVPNGPPVAQQKIVEAQPYAFPNGPIRRSGKLQGFKIGVPLGQSTTDNTRHGDGYRYHDAIHLAFVAVLGWSPTIRALLRLKRKSKINTDRNEDGARAIFTEEGLAAVLSRLAPRRMGFLGENTVDGQVIATAKAVVQDLESESLPGWLWRRAISQGFNAMRELDLNKGGYLKVDLDNRELTYSKMKPHVGSSKGD